MKLYLENIGKISRADIEIKGVTVIAGENNTGKSTVGKVLFSVFESFYESDEGLRATRVKLFTQALETKFSEEFDDRYCRIRYRTIAKRLFNKSRTGEVSREFISEEINKNIVDIDPDVDENGYDVPAKISDKFVEETKVLFDRYCNTPDEKIYASILHASFKSEFDSQICNLFNQKSGKSQIFLNIKDKCINITLANDKIERIGKTISSLTNEVLYIDDPLVLDNLAEPFLYRSDFSHRRVQSHKRTLMRKLLKEEHKNVEAAFNEVLINERLKKIIKKINEICRGSLSYSELNGFSYYDNDLDIKLSSNNISSGLKTFVIIKTLLLNGSLKENGTIILDEPEVHLHPEWQILLAEIIVMLHEEFGIHVLLTTHSPYFLEAIEVYAQKYHVDDKCRYYLAENIVRSSEIIDVTNDTEKIYKKLARPFQDLENARYDSND